MITIGYIANSNIRMLRYEEDSCIKFKKPYISAPHLQPILRPYLTISDFITDFMMGVKDSVFWSRIKYIYVIREGKLMYAPTPESYILINQDVLVFNNIAITDPLLVDAVVHYNPYQDAI